MASSFQLTAVQNKESEVIPIEVPKEKIPSASKEAVDYLSLIGGYVDI